MPAPEDLRYMQMALDLASKAKGNTSPNPMVGCIIVLKNKVVGQGYHKRSGSAHAETMALKQAGFKARNSTMYVTLEPCAHIGRTPPCVNQVLLAGIKRVVIAMKDPNPKTCGKSIRKLRRHNVKVELGILGDQAKKLNEAFIKFMETGLPFVTTKTAQTIDGRIATSTGESKWITSLEARTFSKKKRDEFDAILVGVNTVLKDDPVLDGKGKTKKGFKIIIDPRFRMPLSAKVLKNSNNGSCIIVTSDRSTEKKMKPFLKTGARILTCPLKQGYLDLNHLLKQLGCLNIVSLLIEGGGKTIGHALNQKIVDKMMIYIAPSILADDRALPSFTGSKIDKLHNAIRLTKTSVETIGTDILMEGYVYRNR